MPPRVHLTAVSRGAAEVPGGLTREAPMKILHTGFTISQEIHHGYYRLVFWWRLDGKSGLSETRYDHLTHTELVDVVLAHLDDDRPGYDREDGYTQPTLPLAPQD
jgi:hypothetical protein